MNTQPDVYLFGQVLGTHSFLLTGDFLQPDEYAEIKARFRARMRGFLPAPVERMLEGKHGMFDHCAYDYQYDGANGDATALCEKLTQ